MVQVLIQAGANKDVQTLYGHETVLDIARTNRYYKIVDYLAHITELASQLRKATQEHNIAAMRDLICKGAPATMADEDGNTAIHISIQNNGTTNPTEDDFCTRELLRATGPIAITLRNKLGQTPLHIAAQKGNVLIATYLLRHHLKQQDQINIRDDDGNTPSHYITTRFMGKLFLHHHADLSLINKKGETPLSKFDLWKSILTTTGLQQSAGTLLESHPCT
jgi:ankyrin repeat protein